MGNYDPAFNQDVTFANNAAVSSGIDISKLSALGFAVRVPSGWTAANIGFQVSDDAVASQDLVTNWETLYGDTGSVGPVVISGIVTNAAARYLSPVTALAGVNSKWLRLVSRDTTTFATPVNQASGPKTLKIYVTAG